ncbi:unnamed protein product [Cunninghamella echinulata]
MNKFIYAATTDLYTFDASPTDFDMMKQHVKEIKFSDCEEENKHNYAFMQLPQLKNLTR